MRFQFIFKQSPANTTQVWLVPNTKTDFLIKSGLNKEEAAFVHKQSEAAKTAPEPILINRYKSCIWIVVCPASPTNSLIEKIRLNGSRIVQHVKSNKQDTIAVHNLCKDNTLLMAIVEGIALSSYTFDKYFSDKKQRRTIHTCYISGSFDKKEMTDLLHSILGTFISRDLVNEPVQYLTATQLSKEIQRVSKEAGFHFEYLTKKKIESLKMGGLLGVNKGSVEPPTFNILEWKPKNAINKNPLILVGKGVVYDTGGSSLKTSQGMEKMKGDMAGAAAVTGVLYAIAKSKLNYHVIGLIPATDNRIGNRSIVPGDILTMSNGKTVEVLNTDAEGRLILADALHYAARYKPSLVIDMATLTGAAVAAIGELGIVGLAKDAEEDFELLQKSGWEVYERIVRFPLWDEYNEMIKSPIADIKNIGGPLAGAITAGKFLEHFVTYPWIHLDLSNALSDRNQHYRTAIGTGAGTRLMISFIKQKIKRKK